MANLIDVEKIQKFLEEKNLSKMQFCKLADISENVFEQIMTQDFDFRASNLFKVVRLMKIKIWQIFK